MLPRISAITRQYEEDFQETVRATGGEMQKYTLQDGKIIWIDCGCAYGTGQGGRLSCLRLETEERFYESAG